MQRAQTSQFKSTLAGKRAPHALRYSDGPISLDSAAQHRSPGHKPTRLLRALKTESRPIGNTLRVLADGNTARGGETGSGAFYEAQEEAARRIAQRLHDESAQMLATIYLQLAAIAQDCPDGTVRKINLVVKQLDGVREQLRGMSHELSPPILDQLGLMPALQSLANGVSGRSGLKLMVSGHIPDLPHLVGAVLYRVVQEALSNVVRHAEATEAVVKLAIENGKIYCSVTDNGVGFRPTAKHQKAVLGLGLAGIHERVTALNGRCEIASGPEGGLQLNVEIPL